jgi:arylsulfatase A-like enzyme
MDRLALEGALFQHFYVSPVCSPTRAEFLTGRYHPRSGVYGTSAGGERMDLDEHTIAETFRAAGYATAVFGKWHNGSQYPYHPLGRGFDTFYGFPSGHWGHYFDWTLEEDGHLVSGNGFIVDDLTDRALQFIEGHRDRPFFAYVALNTPHSPMQVPDRFFDRFENAVLEMPPQDPVRDDLIHTKAALAMCENIDWNLGRILQRLADLEIDEHTIVLYLGDNGPNGWRWNGGLRGIKGSTDEGGVRVPCFIRWPGRIPAGSRIVPIAAAIDLLPTLAELAGIPVGAQKPLDGVSLTPLLDGRGRAGPERVLFSHWNGRVSARSPRFRLDHDARLYDIQEDPGQTRDVTAEHPDVAAALAEAVETWRNEVLAGLGDDARPFPVGHPAFPITHLPARDGVPHGGIERSNRFPNDSYFTNWTDTGGRITWDVEVATSGRYEAVVHYTCPPDSRGARVVLRLGDNEVAALLVEPHDPPLVGAGHDRIPRQESYVKAFRPWKLGEMHLDAGPGTLTLSATHVPHGQVMDVWRVTLTLLEGH